MENYKIVVFESKKIRRIWHNEEWFFAVVDICGALTNSADAGAYWRKLKQRLNREGSEVVTFCHGLKLEASDGTAWISKATFGITPAEYKELKRLAKKNQNLRDHMTDLELIFTMLGERVTTEISRNEKPETFEKNRKVAKRGGRVAGTARKETEKELGRSVVTGDNFLPLPDKKKRLK